MWTIQEQTEKTFKTERQVKCKHVKFFPIQNGNEVQFGKLKFVCLRIVISNGKQTLKLTLNTHRGIDNPSFTITHPGILGQPETKEKIDFQPAFEKRLTQFAGESLKNEVMEQFVNRIVGIVA